MKVAGIEGNFEKLLQIAKFEEVSWSILVLI